MGGEKENNVRRICGDGLQLRMDSNDCVLEVTGDGCRITVAKNRGSVRVVGDGCHLKIGHNVGDIEYNGDGGQVHLGPRSSKEKVKYVGDGGRVTFEGDSKDGKREVPREVSPEAENALNEAKERKRTERSSRRTKIVTSIDGEERVVVKKWFVNPGLVIDGYDGAKVDRRTKARAASSV